MNLFKTTLLAVATIFCATSCLNDDNDLEQKVAYNLIYNYSYITDTQSPDAEPIMLEGAKYNFSFNLVKKTVDVTIEDLQVNPSGVRSSYFINNLSYTIGSDGVINISAPTIQATMSNGGTSVINDFKLRMTSAVVNNKQSMYYDIAYNVDSRYDIRVVTRANIFPTTTTITDADNKVTTLTDAYFGYYIDLDKKQLNISIYNITLNDKYYSEINFLKMDYKIGASAGFTAVTDGSPVATDFANSQLKDFEVTNFNARGTYLPELYTSFTLNGTTTVSLRGTYKTTEL